MYYENIIYIISREMNLNTSDISQLYTIYSILHKDFKFLIAIFSQLSIEHRSKR